MKFISTGVLFTSLHSLDLTRQEFSIIPKSTKTLAIYRIFPIHKADFIWLLKNGIHPVSRQAFAIPQGLVACFNEDLFLYRLSTR